MKQASYILTGLLAGLIANASPANAGDPLTSAIQAAYAPYRTALFKTNSKSQAESREAVRAAQKRWGELAPLLVAPPFPYAGDRRLAADHAEVDRILARAAAEIEANQLAQAHETLERVRDILGGLRLRNGVVVFSDRMNAYHEAMEHLIDEAPRLLSGEPDLRRLALRVGVLGYLAKRLAVEAGELAADAEFRELLAAVLASTEALEKAVAEGQPEVARAALTNLKKPYSRLFLHYG